MSKLSQYLAQEHRDGRWHTVQKYDDPLAAWKLAACFTESRVLHRGQSVPRPSSLDIDEGDGRSIVKSRYRGRYLAQNDSNGDSLAAMLRRYLHVDAREDGAPCIDRGKLIEFAKVNGLWNEKYGRLNNGQIRMNVGNRLRAKIRKDPAWGPKWPEPTE